MLKLYGLKYFLLLYYNPRQRKITIFIVGKEVKSRYSQVQ